MRWTKNSRSTRRGAMEKSADCRQAGDSQKLGRIAGSALSCYFSHAIQARSHLKKSSARFDALSSARREVDPRQLMLVMMKMQEPRSRNGNNAAHDAKVRCCLEFDRTYAPTDGPALEPLLHVFFFKQKTAYEI